MTTKKTTKAKKKDVSAPIAIHAEHGDGVHVVGLGNIRVIIKTDSGGWFAQGLEIDYAAQGESIDEVKLEFEDGLYATVHEHLRIYGSIEKLLTAAPQEYWTMANSPMIKLAKYTTVATHKLIRDNSKYEGIDYLIATAEANERPTRVC